jgi:hypothetical protein
MKKEDGDYTPQVCDRYGIIAGLLLVVAWFTDFGGRRKR